MLAIDICPFSITVDPQMVSEETFSNNMFFNAFIANNLYCHHNVTF